jgi:hypothetical protein
MTIYFKSFLLHPFDQVIKPKALTQLVAIDL